MEEPVTLREHPRTIENEVSTTHDSIEIARKNSGNIKKSLILLVIIFSVALTSLLLAYKSLPDSEEMKAFKLPTSIDDAKILGRVLLKYRDSHFYYVLVGFFVTYVFLQSFAIPGSFFLSIISGFLFKFYLAIFLVCLASSTGASFCYLLSLSFGKDLVWWLWPERAAEWSKKVQKQSSNLLNYMIFLRVTPFVPNWFINLASPIIGVPLGTFFLGTFLGVAPPSFLTIQMGTTLQELAWTNGMPSLHTVAVLCSVGLISMLPVVFKEMLKQKFD